MIAGVAWLLPCREGLASDVAEEDFDTLFKLNFEYKTQVFLFVGIFIAFAVKTPTILLNNWNRIRARVEEVLALLPWGSTCRLRRTSSCAL